jgi:hypothetical protein
MIRMDNNEALIREMLHRADMRLNAQQQLAIAADARAMQFVGICIAAASVTIAIGGEAVQLFHFAIAGMLIAASAFAFWAAKPIEWHAPGMQPSAFDDDLASGAAYQSVMLELCGHLDKCISENSKILAENANHFRLAFVAAALAPIFGVVAMVIGSD